MPKKNSGQLLWEHLKKKTDVEKLLLADHFISIGNRLKKQVKRKVKQARRKVMPSALFVSSSFGVDVLRHR